jgi:hypothetical protein
VDASIAVALHHLLDLGFPATYPCAPCIAHPSLPACSPARPHQQATAEQLGSQWSTASSSLLLTSMLLASAPLKEYSINGSKDRQQAVMSLFLTACRRQHPVPAAGQRCVWSPLEVRSSCHRAACDRYWWGGSAPMHMPKSVPASPRPCLQLPLGSTARVTWPHHSPGQQTCSIKRAAGRRG